MRTQEQVGLKNGAAPESDAIYALRQSGEG